MLNRPEYGGEDTDHAQDHKPEAEILECFSVRPERGRLMLMVDARLIDSVQETDPVAAALLSSYHAVSHYRLSFLKFWCAFRTLKEYSTMSEKTFNVEPLL